MTFRALFFVSIVALAGCPMEPHDRPDVKCADACEKRIVGCTSHQCERGCAFVLDRLVEHEQDTVLACVEKGTKCDDPAWADCASKVGAHVDGGPPVPPDVSTDVETE